MTTTADSTTYGSISNDPGRRCENQQTNKVHTTANVSGGTTTTTTVAASYGSAATTVALNATVDAAETAIFTVRRSRTTPSTLPTAKVTGTATRAETGAVASPFGTRVNGSGYTNGTYTNVALSGGSGYGATATLTVSGGAVTAATLVRGGQWYKVGDTLSCQLIGPGTLFALPVATITQG
jgi:hypothetical protein